MEVLKVENLTLAVRYQASEIELVKNVSFSLNKGETLALVGESGSGKSLTALAIVQLLPPGIIINPDSIISLEGEDLLTYSELMMRRVRGRKIAMIFQEAIAALNPVLTIGEQILEVLNFHFKLSRKAKHSKAISLLNEVGIPDPDYHLNTYPHQLSGGLKQRAMIAIALAGEPELLIADEPTTALDVTLQAQIIQLLKSLQEKRAMSLIFITHDLGIVYEIANQVAVLYKGKIVESASRENFFKSPKHPYSHKLFAALPGWLQPPVKKRSSEEQELLVVKDLKVYYPIKKGIIKRTVGYIKAVDGIDLKVKKGTTLALVGESGSGKTTTGMAILRLTNITNGNIYFKDHNLAKLSSSEMREQRKNLQVVFQDPYGSMNPRMLVGDIIAEGLRPYKVGPLQRAERINELLQYVGLDINSQYRYPHEFSGGQRQRICIARALAMEPELLICDEPTSALDVSAQLQVLKLLQKLQQDKGLSYILITHNIAVVAYMADTVAVMHHGKIVEAGSVDDVLHNPREPYTQKLLSAVPNVPKSEFLLKIAEDANR